mmetsp:Transcript_84614/g.182414  ORF Transcript_84614/g.182414 Transcript_84614/m.182414 type:complete len:120 (+) Transcript_84614:35-394(+)
MSLDLIRKLVPPFIAKAYKNNLARRLAAYGVHYDDLLVETVDVKVAVSRLPEEQLIARQRRIKRAFDLSAKHEHMHVDKNAFNADDYLKSYLGDAIEEAKTERLEIQAMNKTLLKVPRA